MYTPLIVKIGRIQIYITALIIFGGDMFDDHIQLWVGTGFKGKLFLYSFCNCSCAYYSYHKKLAIKLLE